MAKRQEYVCKIVRSIDAKDGLTACKNFVEGFKPGRIIPVEVRAADGNDGMTYYVTLPKGEGAK